MSRNRFWLNFFFDRLLSGIYYLNQVLYDPDHSVELSIVFMLYRLINFAETQRCQRVFLPFCFINRAFDECDFYLAHVA